MASFSNHDDFNTFKYKTNTEVLRMEFPNYSLFEIKKYSDSEFLINFLILDSKIFVG